MDKTYQAFAQVGIVLASVALLHMVNRWAARRMARRTKKGMGGFSRLPKKPVKRP
ncbi:MAG: hypothetical protein OEW12_06560 [Deltaproteobacteria bacterium]|nr:hypothetical protein [Deltaproteobacteria bacterium]